MILRMRLRSPSRLLLLGLLAGCGTPPATGSAGHPAGIPAPEPEISVPTSVVILYHPVEAHYRIHTEDSLSQDMPDGTTQATAIVRTSYITLIETDSLPMRIRVDLDSVTLASPDSALQALADSAAGASWTGRMTAWGRLENLTADRAALFADQLEPLVRTFFPVLPQQGARPGMHWSDSLDIPFRALARFDAVEVRQSRFEARGYLVAAGEPALQIDSDADYSVTGSGIWFGQNMTVQGQGHVSGTHAIALDGRLVAATMTDSASLTLTLPDVGQSVPARIRSRATLTLLP